MEKPTKVKKHVIVSSAVKPEMKIALDELAARKNITRSVLINTFLEWGMDNYQAAEGERFEAVVYQ